MLVRFIQNLLCALLLTVSGSLSALFLDNIEQTPLILGNHDESHNSLQGSAYELLKEAKESILIISFSFSDNEVLKILNEKAAEGVAVWLVLDRDHMTGIKPLHPSIKVGTRKWGEGHLHHKIMVVDQRFVWMGSANITTSALKSVKNLAVGFYSPEVALGLHQEAFHITTFTPRVEAKTFSCSFGDQLLEFYLLPHNAPEAPLPEETKLNEKGKQKLISLIDQAQHHLKISVDVWTFKDASRAVVNAMKRGVKVDVVVGNRGDEAVKILIENGLPVTQGKNLHYKLMLVDHKILLNGSPNWSMNAFSRSDESFCVLYQLTEEQLEVLEGVLQTAGLPTERHYNEGTPEPAVSLYSEAEIQEHVKQVQQTLMALQGEIEENRADSENQRLIVIAKRLSLALEKYIPELRVAPVPGCCLYQGDDYLANVVAIAEKQERVHEALKYIKAKPGAQSEVDLKVAAYFQRTLKKLQSGINAPLPSFFHATRAGLENIIRSHTIIQSPTGFTGKGTYMSCNNEGDHGYGSHAFAIDEGCLVDTVALFRTGRHPITNVFFSLWASVHKDIPVSDTTIAFIDTSAMDIPYVEALLKEQGLEIEVVDRATAEGILRLLDLTTKRRELPSFNWVKFNPIDYLPQNMYPRSVQGTFREFKFS